jgi:tape measure domain-containing protein
MNEIDNRIVSMEFDNRKFESNIQTSIHSLRKLDDSLIFKNGKNGFQEIEDAARETDLSPIERAIDKIESRFTLMGIVGDQIIRTLTNRAIAMTESIAKALTIEPIKSGFNEYETQMKSIQTILANTKSKGTTLDQVNAALDDLNHYADKTIYNFTQMTENIGRFTAAGVDLDTSTKAIKGIANLAATSGSTAQQTSTAMYQLSQALASGAVKLMDWNSVVNANMGGEIFQNSLMETARVHGIQIDKMIAKEGSFRETLKNSWLTSDILTETLEKFTESYEDLTDAEIVQRVEYWKNKGYTEEQAVAILELGQTATDAATKVRTFTQLFDTLKEAMQSGWTMSWRYIIGDFDEATNLLTAVNDEFSNIISSAAETRNAILEVWHDNGGRDLLIASLQNIYAIFKQIGSIAHQVWTAIFPPITGETLTSVTAGFYTLTDVIREAMGISVDYSETMAKAITETSDTLDSSASAINGSISEGLTKNEEKAKELYAKMPKWMQHWVDVSGSSELARITNWRKSNQDAWYEYWEAVTGQDQSSEKQALSIYSQMPNWMKQWVDKTGSRDLDRIANWRPKNQALWNAYWDSIASKSEEAKQSAEEYFEIDAVSGADGTVFSDDTVSNVSLLSKLLLSVSAVANVVKSALSALATGGIKLVTVTLSPLITILSSITGAFLDWITVVATSIQKSNLFEKAVDSIVELLSPLGAILANIIEYLEDFWSKLWNGGLGKAISRIFTGIFNGFMLLVGGIGLLASEIGSYISSSQIIKSGLSELKNVAQNVGEFVAGVVSTFKDFGASIVNSLKGSELLTEFGNDIKKAFDRILEKLSGVYGKIKNTLIRIRDTLFGDSGINDISESNAQVPLTFPEKIKQIVDRITPIVDKIKSFIKSLVPEDIRVSISNFFNSLLPVKVIKDFLSKFEGLSAVEIYRKIKAFFKNLDPSSLISDFVDKIKNVDYKGIWNKFKDFARDLNPVENIKKILSSFSVDGIKKTISNSKLIAKIKNFFSTFISRIVGAFPDFKEKFVAKVSPLIDKAKQAFGWFGERLKALFEYIFGGGFFGVIKSLWHGLIFLKVIKTINNITKIFTSPLDALDDLADGFNNMAEAFKSKIKNIGSTVLKISIGVGILVAALWALSKLDPDAFRSAMFGLVAILVVITGFVRELGKVSENGESADKVGTAILKMSIAVALLVRSIKKIAQMDMASLGKGLVGMYAMIRLISSGMKQKVGTQSMEASAGTLIGMAIAVRILVKAVSKLSSMNIEDLGKGLVSMWAIIRMISTSISQNTSVLNRGQKYRGAGLLSYVGLAASVWALSQTLKRLGEMDLGVLLQGLTAIRVLLTGMSKLMRSSKGVKFASGVSMIMMGLAVEIFVHAASKLGEIDAWSITKGLIGIRVLIKGMSELSKNINGGLKIGQTFLMLITMAGMMYIFFKAMKKMEGLDGGNTLAISASISLLVSSLSYSISALSRVSFGAAAKASAIILAVIGVIGLIAWGLGSLLGTNGASSVAKSIDDASKVMRSIGNFLGSFFRGLLGITDKAPTGSMTSIGTALSTFMTDLEPFLEKVQKVDGSSLSGIRNLGAAALAITGAGVAEAFGSLLTGWLQDGKTSAQVVMDSLNTLADGLATYQTKANGIDQAKIDVVNTAITSVGDMVKEHVPAKTFWDALTYAITGVSDLTMFAMGLGSLGTAVSTYSAQIQNVDSAKISETTPLIQGLVDISNSIPEKGVIALMLEKVARISSLQSFCDSLIPLATALNSYSNAIGYRTNWDNVTNSSSAIQAIVDVANTVPKEGLADKYLKLTNFGSFINDLASLKDPLREYVDAFTGDNAIDTNEQKQANRATGIFKSIIEAANLIPEQGFFDKLFDKTDMQTFVSGMSSLGEGIRSYVTASGNLTESDVAKIGTSVSVLRAFVTEMQGATSSTDSESVFWNITHMWDGLDGFDVASYGSKLAQFGRDIGVFAYYLGNRASNSVSEAVANAESMFPRITALFTNKDVSGDYDIFGSLLLNMTNALTLSMPSFYDAGGSVIAEVIRGMNEANPSISSTLSDLVDGAAQSVNASCISQFYDIGKNIAIGLANGIFEYSYLARNAARTMAGSVSAASKSSLLIYSPSRVFFDMGMYCAKGLANGITENSNMAESSAISMAEKLAFATEYALQGINDALNSDNHLVITPVLDLSSVQTGITSMDNMLASRRNIAMSNASGIAGITARNASAISSQINQNGSDLSGIIGAISSVNDRIDALGEKMASMQIVLNSGALVGQIAGDMDRNLGQRTIMRGRGN